MFIPGERINKSNSLANPFHAFLAPMSSVPFLSHTMIIKIRVRKKSFIDFPLI